MAVRVPDSATSRMSQLQNPKSCANRACLRGMLRCLFVISPLLAISFSLSWATEGPSKDSNAAAAQKGKKRMEIQVTSNAFSEGGAIPEKYTCDGQNVSPPLKWSGVPANAESIAIICEDPDAPSGTFTHWVLYDIVGKTTELPEGSTGGGKEGVNDFKKNGYGGPCPPPGKPHRYFFRVYALDTNSLGNAGSSKDDVTTAMKGHIVAQGQVMGTYKRSKK